MAEMTYEEYIKMTRQNSENLKQQAETQTGKIMSNVKNPKIKTVVDAETGKIKTMEITGEGTTEFFNEFDKTREISSSVTDNNYGNYDTTVRDYAKRFYGDNAEKHTQGIAQAIFGKDFKAPEGSDIGSYTFNPAEKLSYGERLGVYLANNREGLIDDNINTTQYSGTNIRSAFNEENKKILKKQNINNELDLMGKNHNLEMLTGDDRKNLYNKIFVEKNGDLSDKEIELFQNIRSEVASMKPEIEKIAADNGYNASDIFNSDFGTHVGKHQAAYQAAYENKSFLNYDIVDGKLVEVESLASKIDYLKNAQNKIDYSTAKSKFTGDEMKYLEDTEDAFYGSKEAKTLHELKKAGIDVENADEILKGYAYAKNANLHSDNAVVNNLNSASAEAIQNYNISEDNLKYLSGNGLILTNTDGKFSLSQESIDNLTPEEREKWKKTIESKDIGQSTELGEINDVLDRRYQENKVLEDINNKIEKNGITTNKFSLNNIDNQDITSENVFNLGKGEIVYESSVVPVAKDFTELNASEPISYGTSGDIHDNLFDLKNRKDGPSISSISQVDEGFNNYYSISGTTGYNSKYSGFSVEQILREKPDITLETLQRRANTESYREAAKQQTVNLDLYDSLNFKKSYDKETGKYYSKDSNQSLNTDISNEELSLYEQANNNVKYYGSDIENTYIVNKKEVEPRFSINQNINNDVTPITPFTINKETVTTNPKLNSFEDVKEEALKNYNRARNLQTEAQEKYEVKLENKNVFEDIGVRDKKALEELSKADDFKKLSPATIGALYGADSKVSVGRSVVKQAAGEMADRALKIGEEKLTDEQFLKTFGFDKPNKKGLDFKFKDQGNVAKWLESIDGDNLNLEELGKNVQYTGNKAAGGLTIEKILNLAKQGKLEDELKKTKYNTFMEKIGLSLDKYLDDNADKYDDKSMESARKVVKKFKDRDFTEAERDKILNVVEQASEYKETYGGIKAKGSGMKKFFSGKVTKGGMILAGGIAATAFIGKLAGDAAEERERKRQEMNQLIAQQNMSIRGGY